MVRRHLLVPVCLALSAVGCRPLRVLTHTGNPQPTFMQAARDQLRRELPGVVAVIRLPTGRESTWVALVRRDSPDTSALARLNRAAPYFLTWVLGDTEQDHRALLASLAATAPAPAILYDSLVADSLFTQTVFAAASGRPSRWTRCRQLARSFGA